MPLGKNILKNLQGIMHSVLHTVNNTLNNKTLKALSYTSIHFIWCMQSKSRAVAVEKLLKDMFGEHKMAIWIISGLMLTQNQPSKSCMSCLYLATRFFCAISCNYSLRAFCLQLWTTPGSRIWWDGEREESYFYLMMLNHPTWFTSTHKIFALLAIQMHLTSN